MQNPQCLLCLVSLNNSSVDLKTRAASVSFVREMQFGGLRCAGSTLVFDPPKSYIFGQPFFAGKSSQLMKLV